MRAVFRKWDWVGMGIWFGCLGVVKLGILIHDFNQSDSGRIFWLRTGVDSLILVSFASLLVFLFFSFQKADRVRSECSGNHLS